MNILKIRPVYLTANTGLLFFYQLDGNAKIDQKYSVSALFNKTASPQHVVINSYSSTWKKITRWLKLLLIRDHLSSANCIHSQNVHVDEACRWLFSTYIFIFYLNFYTLRHCRMLKRVKCPYKIFSMGNSNLGWIGYNVTKK